MTAPATPATSHPLHSAPTIPTLEVLEDERTAFYTVTTMGSDERDALDTIDFMVSIDPTF